MEEDSGVTVGSIPTFKLANDITIPMVGLGSASGVAYPHVQSAIELGYRFVDTAQSSSWGYREEEVGKAVLDAKRRYEDLPNVGDRVFVQTKIHPQDLGYESTKKAIKLSLDILQVASLDSVLIHKPRCWEGICAKEPEGTWHDSWRALEEAVESGVVRSIGICDVDNQIMNELLKKRIAPTIIQNWFDPFHQDARMRHRIHQHNQQNPDRKILYQGYSSLGTQWYHHKGYEQNPVLNHPTLQTIAARHGASVPQVVIQWATRRGVMVLPASTKREHQESNLNSFFFELSEHEMGGIDFLDGKPPKNEKIEEEKDLNAVELSFINKHDNMVHVYWIPEGGEARDFVHVGTMQELGSALTLTSYHGHSFVFREGRSAGTESIASKILHRHVVDRELGATQKHDIIDMSEEL